jgi:hypothetical protein
MKKLNKTTLALAVAMGGIGTANASVLFTDDFENPPHPTVSGVTKTVPTGWVGSNFGFNSNRRGLANEDATTTNGGTPATFTTAGSQAAATWFFNNAGLTTIEGAIGALAVDVEYTVTFNAGVMTNRTAGGTCHVDLMVFDMFDALDFDTYRDRPNAVASTILASVQGLATSFTTSDTDSFTFTALAGDASIGKDLAIRIHSWDSGGEVLIDNMLLTDNIPEPTTTALLGLGGLALILRRRK